jgi:hypothetical protein
MLSEIFDLVVVGMLSSHQNRDVAILQEQQERFAIDAHGEVNLSSRGKDHHVEF